MPLNSKLENYSIYRFMQYKKFYCRVVRRDRKNEWWSKLKQRTAIKIWRYWFLPRKKCGFLKLRVSTNDKKDWEGEVTYKLVITQKSFTLVVDDMLKCLCRRYRVSIIDGLHDSLSNSFMKVRIRSIKNNWSNFH